MLKKVIISICVAGMVSSMAACGGQRELEKETEEIEVVMPQEQSTVVEAPVASEESGTENKFKECYDEEEMFEISKTKIILPKQKDLPEWVKETQYSAIPGLMLEVRYVGDDGKMIKIMASSAVGFDMDGLIDEMKEADRNGNDYNFSINSWSMLGKQYSVVSSNSVPYEEVSTIVKTIR